VNYNGPKVGSL